MLEIRIAGVRLRVSLLFPALMTVLLLRQPDGTAALCLLASVLHEGGHLAAMLWFHCPPSVCVLSAFGARIEMDGGCPVGYRQNAVISAAGPAVNLLLAALLWIIGCRRASAVNLLLAGVNLLPASALDGGQILGCLLCRRLSPLTAERILRAVSAAVLMPLATLSAWLCLSGRGNGTLLIVSGYLCFLIFFHPTGNF